MKNFILPVMALLFVSFGFSQNTLTAIVKDKETKVPLLGASANLLGTTIGTITDKDGYLELNNIPDGNQVIVFRFMGY